MGTPADVLPNSIAYFRTYFTAAWPYSLYNIAVGILQAVGDSRHPLYYLILSSFVNIALDLLFVAVFHWGVASAAAATVISQTVSALLCIWQLMRSSDVYHVDLKRIRFHAPMLKQIVRFGLPSGIQNSVIGLANVVVQANINVFGSDAMAGCGSYAKVEGFAFLPVTCFAMGLATFVSQNLGAKQYDRVKKGARFGILCSVTLAEVVGLLIFFGAPLLIVLFNDDPRRGGLRHHAGAHRSPLLLLPGLEPLHGRHPPGRGQGHHPHAGDAGVLVPGAGDVHLLHGAPDPQHPGGLHRLPSHLVFELGDLRDLLLQGRLAAQL